MHAATLTGRLKDEAARLGFVACGVTRALDDPLAAARLDEWLADGSHGTMGWMADRAHHRRSPRALWPEARSAVMLGMSYAPPRDPRDLAAARDRGRVSVYAQGRDYHDVLKSGLKALARWLADETGVPLKLFVDTAPVMEKPLAAAAGLGWQGKHTNLLSRAHGSWLLLGALLTAADLDADAPERGGCGSCTACLAACPTDAFPAPYRIDARRCVSYLTIEHKGPIPVEFRRAIGNRIYGCDDCLAACPWNKFADAARANIAFAGRAELAAPALGDLLELDDAGFRTIFAGSPIKRIGRDRFVRNVAIAAGNSGDETLVPRLRALAEDPCEVVRDAARWALDALTAPCRVG